MPGLRRLACLILAVGLFVSLLPGVWGRPAEREPGPSTASGRGWALVIGINYEEGGAVKVLRNAENDARGVAKLLETHYGFAGRVKLLLGKEATHAAITAALTDDFLARAKDKDKEVIEEQDRLLVFFAGHAERGPKGEGLILPHDHNAKRGKDGELTGFKDLGVHADLIRRLEKCPARHTLLILDCCHSGTVYGETRRAVSAVDDRKGVSLKSIRSFQALASCRATQAASDGDRDHSPFTEALLRTLREVPAMRGSGSAELTVTDVFREMRSRLALRREQEPDLRPLIEQDGEFYFYPEGNFSAYAPKALEVQFLQALVPGEHGNWWFEEVPWFFPGVRKHILDAGDSTRSSTLGQAMTKADLAKWAWKFLDDVPDKKLDLLTRTLDTLRKKHLKMLLDASRGREKRMNEVICEVTEELVKWGNAHGLTPEDHHLLAVLTHKSDPASAAKAYTEALKAYELAIRVAKPEERRGLEALLALCQADHATYLQNETREYDEAIHAFEQARQTAMRAAASGSDDKGQFIPLPFLVYTLVSEADCWQALNRWGEANQRLDIASGFALRVGKDPLAAFIHRRRAWSLVDQWRIRDARAAFETANALMATDSDATAHVAQLHNRHGLAMIQRFAGNTKEATRLYRSILKDILDQMRDLRDRASESAVPRLSFGSAMNLYQDRWINSLERLGDCNLFGDPAARDLREAADDYRQAIRLCHYKGRSPQRELERAALMYRLTLTLALPGAGRDLELARRYLAQANLADTFADPDKKDSRQRFYRDLVPAMVEVCAASEPTRARMEQAKALKGLREVLAHLRDELQGNIHRDSLEILLFASRLLVEERVETDRFETLEDAELLLHFCRKVLSQRNIEAVAYLKPYYQSAMKAMLQAQPTGVKSLMELAWESTTGRIRLKPADATPVLALCWLGDRGYLLLDVPSGSGKVVPIDTTREELQRATGDGATRLKLPRDLAIELDTLRRASTETEGFSIVVWSESTLAGPADPTKGSAIAFPYDIPAARIRLPELRVVAR